MFSGTQNPKKRKPSPGTDRCCGGLRGCGWEGWSRERAQTVRCCQCYVFHLCKDLSPALDRAGVGVGQTLGPFMQVGPSEDCAPVRGAQRGGLGSLASLRS